jgi:7-carboxy-7-deazaguanine synthase
MLDVKETVRTIAVSESFGPTIQGEGAVIGVPTVFVRTGGCDYRCSWCDTLYAVLPEYKSDWKPMTAEEVFADVQRLSGNTPILVTLSGGNPAIQPLGDLIDLGHTYGYTFAIETQGSVAPRWFARLDNLTLSPKPPSSQQITRWDRLDRCIEYARDPEAKGDLGSDHVTQISLKIVIFDEEDFAYARNVAERYPDIPIYLQPGNHTPPLQTAKLDMDGILARLDWLIQRVIAEKWYRATVLPQLHVLLWGNKRGV